MIKPPFQAFLLGSWFCFQASSLKIHGSIFPVQFLGTVPRDSKAKPEPEKSMTGWWFQLFFIFTLTLGNDPIWLIFFRWVETTNQMRLVYWPIWAVLSDEQMINKVRVVLTNQLIQSLDIQTLPNQSSIPSTRNIHELKWLFQLDDSKPRTLGNGWKSPNHPLKTASWWFQIFFYFHPYLGDNPIWLAHIFQMGWFNHQLDWLFRVPGICKKKRSSHQIQVLPGWDCHLRERRLKAYVEASATLSCSMVFFSLEKPCLFSACRAVLGGSSQLSQLVSS